MRRNLILLVMILLLSFGAVQAQAARVCNPFTTTPDAGMLAVGTVVVFNDYGVGGMFSREGRIESYYIAACWPGAPVPGLEAQAYVISYGDPLGAMTVLNRGRFEVK